MYKTCPNLIKYRAVHGTIRNLHEHEIPIYAAWEAAFTAVLNLPETPTAMFYRDLAIGQEFSFNETGVVYRKTEHGYTSGRERIPGPSPLKLVIAYHNTKV